MDNYSIYDGDVRLADTLSGGEIKVKNGSVEMTQGLDTAVYLSLFTRKNWWGNNIQNFESEKYNADFETLLSAKATNEARREAEVQAESALSWLIDENIAESVIANASFITATQIKVEITITKPNNTDEKYTVSWDATEQYFKNT